MLDNSGYNEEGAVLFRYILFFFNKRQITLLFFKYTM